MSERPLNVTVQDLKAALDAGEDLQLVDVRETWEHAIVHIAGAALMPLGEFPERAATLDRKRPVYVYCHHGGRSLRATQWLRAQGYADAVNVAGGIAQWAAQIDPSLPQY